MNQLFRVNSNFRYFWLASSITTIGDYIDDIAFAQLIYIITRSTLITSYVFAIKIVLTFLSVFTAAFVDKYNKKKIIILTSLGQGFLLVIIFLLYKSNQLNTSILIVFVTVQTVFSTFSLPAQNAILPCLVTEKEMINARSALSIFMQFIQVFAYICSGALIGWIGISGAIALDAITFIVSAIVMIQVDSKEELKQNFDSAKEFLNNVKEGFNFVLSEKVIFSVILVTFLGNMLSSPVDSLMPAYFLQSKYSAYSYSVFMIGIAIGGIVGSWVLTKIQCKFENNKLLSIGFLFGAIGMIILYFNKGIVPYIAAVVIGISYGFVSILNATIIQLRTPKEMTARTFSLFKCISYIAGPLGIVVAGFLGEFLRMNIVFIPFGILLLITSVLTTKLVTSSKGGNTISV